MALAFAFGMAVFQTITFQKRKQQNDIDSFILVKFMIHCCSTIGTVLFGSATLLTVYLYYVYKTQNVIQALPPFYELKIIKFFFMLAFTLKVRRIYQILFQLLRSFMFTDFISSFLFRR